jgi:hypothetical protein
MMYEIQGCERVITMLAAAMCAMAPKGGVVSQNFPGEKKRGKEKERERG